MADRRLLDSLAPVRAGVPVYTAAFWRGPERLPAFPRLAYLTAALLGTALAAWLTQGG
jgi:hypothetical protein